MDEASKLADKLWQGTATSTAPGKGYEWEFFSVVLIVEGEAPPHPPCIARLPRSQSSHPARIPEDLKMATGD
jgi:hypothetical protein